MNTSKSALRKHIREMKQQFTNKELEELSLPVMSRLLAHPAVTEAKTILMYYSLPDEVCTHDTVNRLVQAGKTVLLPKVIDGENMEIRVYESKEDLAEGSYGIMEPNGKLFTDYAKITTAVVPGMSFDADNNRLGRGKGYYDRFLKNIPQAYKIGVCFDFQKEKEIPHEENDIKMDTVI